MKREEWINKLNSGRFDLPSSLDILYEYYITTREGKVDKILALQEFSEIITRYSMLIDLTQMIDYYNIKFDVIKVYMNRKIILYL